MRGLVKICGLACEADTLASAEAGPDALGFVFWPGSPRAVSAEEVGRWTRELPGGIRKVGVFVNPGVEEVREAVERAGLDVVQLHGEEDAEFAGALGVAVWKAVHLDRLQAGWEEYPAEALLVDSGTLEMPGGTGVRVDTERAAAFVAEHPEWKVLLAGGLKPDTVAEAIREVRPYGVDVSSGVERMPGLKNQEAIRRFVAAAREAFSER